MGYILHSRKIVEVVESTAKKRHLFNDRHARVVLIKCPDDFEELRMAAVSIFESTKSSSDALNKITMLSKVPGVEVHVMISKSTSACLGPNGATTHYERKWVNRVYHIIDGTQTELPEDELHFVGWADQACADFFADRFAYDPAHGERANFDRMATYIDGFVQLGVLKHHNMINLDIPEPMRFTQPKGSPAPFDCIVKEEDYLQKAICG